MKIKRYFAPDIRQAIRMVREEQGPDAVILSNRKVDGGVEIVAARDFDEQMLLDRAKAEPRGEPAAAAPEPVATPETDSRRRAEDAFREALGKSAAISRADAAGTDLRRPVSQRAEHGGQGSPAPAKPVSTARREHSAAPIAPVPELVKPSADAEALKEMQRELRQMRRMIDLHLSEAGWQAAASRHPTRLDLLRRLSALGFSRKLSLELTERLGGVDDADVAWQACQHALARQIPLAEDSLLDYGGVVALVGPTGVGKTTTIAKLAARFRLKHGPRQIALITTDNYRIGALEQLGTYGRILDVPVRAASSVEDLRQLLSSFYDKRLVLIDTAGVGQRDRRLAEQAELFSRSEIPVKSYLVMSAASQLRVMQEAVEAFRAFSPEACIVTKLDETGQLGAALSTVAENRLPVAFVCDGQQVPEDLHVARTHLLLNRCFADRSGAAAVGSPMPSYEDWIVHANV
ncbi:flagellar biosynthetic protein FlhF [Methylocaldum marinum]|uniref:Flagellar biosynthesis protein FlhF n=1 Tax=Methylocaldum marinum TaxID=1432792 RepID=A0A250KRV3_9GAMM|nr:flagellar biosynthesis protein FlhF [Methylocaldum marinum]BBA34337.1 flagellar biosynthetic protein FlhF [Methylocaldum marinum]